MFPTIRTPTQARLSRLFDEVFQGWPGVSREETGSLVGAWIPPVDVFEEKDALRIAAELPGVKPEDVTISVENKILSIRGEKRQLAQEKTERGHRYERCYGVFERSFTIPTTVDGEHIKASYENGVLTVTLPKAERARPREITVQVQKS